MTQTITIKQEDILSEINLQTAYISAKMMETDEKAFSRIATAATDSVFLTPAIEVARTSILAAFRKYVPKFNTTGTSANEELILRLPTNFDTSQISGVTNALVKYYVAYVLYKWLLVTQPNQAEIYGKEAEQHLVYARLLLAKRTPPTYQQPQKPSDDAQTNAILYTIHQ